MQAVLLNTLHVYRMCSKASKGQIVHCSTTQESYVAMGLSTAQRGSAQLWVLGALNAVTSRLLSAAFSTLRGCGFLA